MTEGNCPERMKGGYMAACMSGNGGPGKRIRLERVM